MTPLPYRWWSFRPLEFHCPSCGGEEACRSRPRGLFEAYVLPILCLRPVRCDRCYLRSYVLRTIAVPERPRLLRAKGQPETASHQDSRIA